MFQQFIVCILAIATISIAKTTIDLGSCQDFALTAGSSQEFNGVSTSIYGGNVGLSPGNTIGGSFTVSGGTIEINTEDAKNCAQDRITAYNTAQGAPCQSNSSRVELSGLTLTPGTYCSDSAISFSAGTLTLDGLNKPDSQWIFQAGSTLTTSQYTSFILQNGAKASNVYWALGSSATLASSSSFIGTIIAYASISLGSNTVLTGRGLAGAAISVASQGNITLA